MGRFPRRDSRRRIFVRRRSHWKQCRKVMKRTKGERPHQRVVSVRIAEPRADRRRGRSAEELRRQFNAVKRRWNAEQRRQQRETACDNEVERMARVDRLVHERRTKTTPALVATAPPRPASGTATKQNQSV